MNMENEIAALASDIGKLQRLYDQLHSKLQDKGAKLLNQIQTKTLRMQNIQKACESKEENVNFDGMKKVSTNVTEKKQLPEVISMKEVKVLNDENFRQKSSGDSNYRTVVKPKQINSKASVNELSAVIVQRPFKHSSEQIYASKKSTTSTLENPSKRDGVKNNFHYDAVSKCNSSFTEYRDPANKSRPIQVVQPPLMNPEISSKSSKHKIQGLGSVYTKDVIQSSLVQKAAVDLHSTLMSYPSSLDEEPGPSTLKTSLMKHQRRALSWLSWREKQNPQGGIFADDMGLGKTLTMLSLILKDKEETKVTDKKLGGTLVICLTSILHQWKNEVDTHCQAGKLKVLIYHGSNRDKYHNSILNYDIVLTTYKIVQSEEKAYQTQNKRSPLFDVKWNRIILDEAHTIKNYKTKTAQCIFKLDGTKKWAVTGTPIHNDLKDLYCLLKFLQCKPFDDHDVWKKLINDMTDKSVKRRNTLIKTILLRRCKNDVDEETGHPLIPLPNKHLITCKLQLTDEEQNVYNNISKELRDKYSKFYVKKTDKSVSLNTTRNSGTFLSYLLKLQQCCNHLSLLKLSVEDELDNSVDLDISRTFESLNIEEKLPKPSLSDVSLSFLHKTDFKYSSSDHSSKIKELILKLKEILKKSNNTEKCVVVSQWVSMLKIVGIHLKDYGINYQVIEGSTKPEERLTISQDFNNNSTGFPVLLLSLKAGGVGLNLTGGNHLFLMDMHWNPALENQACDRVHRVGQTRDVFIYKFICVNTIEEQILELQEQKKYLAGTVLNGAKHVPYLTFDDLKRLFEE